MGAPRAGLCLANPSCLELGGNAGTRPVPLDVLRVWNRLQLNIALSDLFQDSTGAGVGRVPRGSLCTSYQVSGHPLARGRWPKRPHHHYLTWGDPRRAER